MARQTALKVTSACLGIFLALIVAEVFVRLVNVWFSRSHIEQGLYVLDDRLGWKLAANASVRQITHDFDIVYHTDGIGRRITKNNVDSGKVISIYGDSFAFGIGLRDEDTFASQLAKELGTVKVINRGVSGYAPDQYYLSFAQDIANMAVSMQLAIFAILPANDFEDLNREHLAGFTESIQETYKPYLAKKGRSFEFMLPSKMKHNQCLGSSCTETSTSPQPQDKNKEHPISEEKQREQLRLFTLLKKSELLRFLYFRLTEFEAFGFIKRFAGNLNKESLDIVAMNEAQLRFNFLVQKIKRSSVPSLFLLIPSESLLLNKADGTKELAAYGLAKKTLENNGVVFVDLLSLMPAQRGYYFSNEGHWNVEGARLAGQKLSAAVKAAGH